MHNTEQECWHLQTSSELANARRRAVPKVPWVSRRPPTSLPPSSLFWQRYLVPTHPMKQRSQDFKPTYRPIKTFTVLTSQDPGPGQSWAVGLGPQPRPPLLSDPQPHNQVGRNCYFKHFNSCVTVVTITISTRASALLHKMLSCKRGNGLRCSQFLSNIVHKNRKVFLKNTCDFVSEWVNDFTKTFTPRAS